MSKIEVKVLLTPEEREHIDKQAKALNLSRSALMRLRALGDPSAGAQPQIPALTVRKYHAAVTGALKAANGSAPRHVVESIVASVVCAIYDKDQEPSEAAKAAG